MSQYRVFLDDSALSINQARQDHLASLGLDLANRQVLEVGAGIGLHTQFWVDRGCEVMITDGAEANVQELRRRWPQLESRAVDLDTREDLRDLGRFDIVYCYGLLYHLGRPREALAMMSEISDMILLELICNDRDDVSLDLVRDPPGLNQSTQGQGCRPSRGWILEQLRGLWGHAYISRTQPDHGEFPQDWTNHKNRNARAVFVGSRSALDNPELLTQPLQQQTTHKKGQ